MNKTDRLKVHKKYDGHCAYCGKPIELTEMQVDHIDPKRKGGKDSIENYNPSCRRCNHYKRSLDLEGFRDYIKTLHERIAKDYITKVGLDYGIVKLTPFDGKFYFERDYNFTEVIKMNPNDSEKELINIENMLIKHKSDSYNVLLHMTIGWISSPEKTYTGNQLKQIFELVDEIVNS